MEKQERGRWLNTQLDAVTKEHGRASDIASKIGVSHAVATGWLNGSLPRDMQTAIKFCDEYGINLREWATGERKDVQGSKQMRDKHLKLVMLAREFERSLGFSLDDKQFELVMSLVEEELLSGEVNIASRVQKWGKVLSFNRQGG